MHKGGAVKIDYERLPATLQKRYGIVPKKAEIFRAAESRRAQQTAEDNQRLLKAQAERDLTKMRAMMDGRGNGDQFSYGGDAAMARATRQIAATMDAAEESRLAAERVPLTFWTAPFWQSPAVRLLAALLGGAGGGGGGAMQADAPREDPYFYKAILRSDPSDR